MRKGIPAIDALLIFDKRTISFGTLLLKILIHQAVLIEQTLIHGINTSAFSFIFKNIVPNEILLSSKVIRASIAAILIFKVYIVAV